MISKMLMYVCLSGAGVLGLAAFALWFARHGAEPVGKMTRAYRRLPWPVKAFLVLYVGIWIAYGSAKNPTNAPPLGMSAPRRSGVVVRSEPWRVGTNETWDFDCPAWASLVPTWGIRGAHDDWFAAGPLGVLLAKGRVLVGGEAFDLYDRPLALVPAACPVGTNAPSRVWYGHAPWGSDVYTWQNAYAGRDTNALVSVQLERFGNGDRICRYASADGVTSRSYLGPRPADADSDGDGVPDAADSDFMDPDTNGDGIVDGVSEVAYWANPLWRANTPEGEPVDITLNEPVVPPAKAVLQVGTLRILLTTNAVYRLSIPEGTMYDVKLTTNGFQPVNLTAERGED